MIEIKYKRPNGKIVIYDEPMLMSAIKYRESNIANSARYYKKLKNAYKRK